MDDLGLLGPVTMTVTQVRKSGTVLSSIRALLTSMERRVHATLPASLLLRTRRATILGCVGGRRSFYVGPVRAARCVLSPGCTNGDVLSNTRVGGTCNIVAAISHRLNLSRNGILNDLTGCASGRKL